MTLIYTNIKQQSWKNRVIGVQARIEARRNGAMNKEQKRQTWAKDS